VNPNNFFAELKRRNVCKVAIAYAVTGWAIAEGASQNFSCLRRAQLGSASGCAADRYWISVRVDHGLDVRDYAGRN
jgi:hypothetical protein